MGSLAGVAGAMEGSGMIHIVVAVTVVNMEPTQAGTIEVRYDPLLCEIVTDVGVKTTLAVGAAVGSGIPHREKTTLKSTMLAIMRLRPAARAPLMRAPRQASLARRRRSPKLQARHRSPCLHQL